MFQRKTRRFRRRVNGRNSMPQKNPQTGLGSNSSTNGHNRNLSKVNVTGKLDESRKNLSENSNVKLSEEIKNKD